MYQTYLPYTVYLSTLHFPILTEYISFLPICRLKCNAYLMNSLFPKNRNFSLVCQCIRKNGWKGTFFRADWFTHFTQLGYRTCEKKACLSQKSQVNWCLKVKSETRKRVCSSLETTQKGFRDCSRTYMYLLWKCLSDPVPTPEHTVQMWLELTAVVVQ